MGLFDGASAAEVTGVAREAARAADNAAAPLLFRESAPSAADAPPLLAATDVCSRIGTADADVVMPMIPPQRYSARSGGWACRQVRKWGGRGSGAERHMTDTPFAAVSFLGACRSGEGSMEGRVLHGPQHGKTGVSDGACEVGPVEGGAARVACWSAVPPPPRSRLVLEARTCC